MWIMYSWTVIERAIVEAAASDVDRDIAFLFRFVSFVFIWPIQNKMI